MSKSVAYCLRGINTTMSRSFKVIQGQDKTERESLVDSV